MKKILLVLASVFTVAISIAQISINTSKTPPDPSAIVDIQSNQKGLLIPRMTSVQRMAINAPASGLLLYDTDSATLFIYSGSWKKIHFNEFFTYYYRDKDADGYGDKFQPVGGFAPLEGFVANNLDCDDNDAAIKPTKVWYRDSDGDGFGNATVTISACTKPSGYSDDASDCNDSNELINPGAEDIPGDMVDSDCDGSDGDESSVVFVSNTGNNANDGTRNAPVATIAAGLAKANAMGKSQVFISTGIYNETITLINGISLFGGYSSNWTRNTNSKTVITGGEVIISGVGVRNIIGIRANAITNNTILDGLEVNTINATNPSASNYGIHCTNCPALQIRNCFITAGKGADGLSGTNGTDGINGMPGGNGESGACDANIPALGGNGPTNSSAHDLNLLCTGGTGGKGGYGSTNGTSGTLGGFSTFTSGFGIGGLAGDPGGNGANGVDGRSGADGAPGEGGVGGNLTTSFFWNGFGGMLGGLSEHGVGGGGGGGGGGQLTQNGFNGTGNGGGGGGAGGMGGTRGAGGHYGGGSFGLFIVNSSGIILINNTVHSMGGAAGGRGGNGSNGSVGGAGGLGGTACTLQVGAGGNGGRGGNGGKGGPGGGGAGGPSFSIYKVGTTINVSGNSLTFGPAGSGGIGGTPQGHPGVVGASGVIN